MKTLLIVDAQKDFMPGGSLAIPDGDHIVPFINKIIPDYDLVVWTKDWHPANHCSFKDNGGIWPEHCVQMTKGSELHTELCVKSGEFVVTKGRNPKFDSYSAFKDDGGHPTGLSGLLYGKGIKEIDVCGLAFEYCVKFSAIDAIKDGLKVNVLFKGCRGMNKRDVNHALIDMNAEGITVRLDE